MSGVSSGNAIPDNGLCIAPRGNARLMIRNVEETFGEFAYSSSPEPGAPATELSVPTDIAGAAVLAGVGSRCCHDQMLQFAPVKEDAATLDAQIHHDAVSHASLHTCTTMRAKSYRHLASFRCFPISNRKVPIRRTSGSNTQLAPCGCGRRGENRSRHLRSTRSSNRRQRCVCRGVLRCCIPQCEAVNGRTLRTMNLRFE
jgi:hypothetical protein